MIKKLKEVVILEHVPNEKAGTILDFLKKEKIPYREAPLYERGVSFPDLSFVRSLVVMGGPMNVYEEDKHPFLKEENAYIQSAVKKNIPYLGVCLGSQLLAKALGAGVYKAKKPEIGWDTIDLLKAAAQDSLFSGLKLSKLKVLQWHEDTFDLPEGAVHLAESKIVPHQAYHVKGLFYGFQFHVEVNRPMLEDWFKDKAELPKILADYDVYNTALSKITEKIYRNFFNL